MRLFGSKRNDIGQNEQKLHSEISELKEKLQEMESIRLANENLKKRLQEVNSWQIEKENIIKQLSRILINKGMDERIVKVFSSDPITLINRLTERFELIDKQVKQEELLRDTESTDSIEGSLYSLPIIGATEQKDECNTLRKQIDLQNSDFAQRESALNIQIKQLKSENHTLNSYVTTFKQALEACQKDAKERIRLINEKKDRDIEDIISKKTDEFNAKIEEIKRQLLIEYEQNFNNKNDSIPSAKEETAIVKQQVIDQLQKVIDTLHQVDYIISCDGNNIETEVMQKSIRNGAQKTLEGLIQLSMSDVNSIAKAQTLIQDYLLKEMEPISCWMRKLAIYSAYANIPFMIDEGRSDGIRFNREATMWSYALLDDMLAGVGIKQIVPAPFIEVISDGDYEDASDSAIKNIGTFCPDYIQRLDRIDRIDTAGIIIDIADVGLMIDGQLFRQAKVII